MRLDHIHDAITTGGGHTLTTITELVHAHGNQRAGEHIIASITQHLADADIHHLPARLPADGKRVVLLYKVDAHNPAIVALLAAEHANAANERGDADSADATIRGLSMIMPKSDRLAHATGEQAADSTAPRPSGDSDGAGPPS